ncbi:Guanylate cyclase [Aphelenchoides bicaudatus]|nr:Guanylate cyclase [Aphelenchoides bicaudatus]
MLPQKTLKVSFFHFYPMVNAHCNKFPKLHVTKDCPMPGLAVEIIKLVTNYLNLTIEVDFTGPIEVLHDQLPTLNTSVDLLALTFERTTFREHEFDFSVPLYEVSSKMATLRADKASMTSIFDFFKVYTSQIWLLVGLAFLIFTLIGLRSYVLLNFLWKMLRLQLIQNEGGINYHLLAGSISLLTFAFLQCSIILSLFQGWILTSVVKTKPPEPFRLEDLPYLLKKNLFSFVSTNIHNWYFEELNSSFQTPFYELRPAMENNPVIVHNNDDVVFDLLHKGNKLLVLQDDERMRFDADKFCDLIYMESPFPTKEKHFMMRKGHPLLPEINRAIFAQKMLILRAQRKYQAYRTFSRCTEMRRREQPLSLNPYLSVFILFAVGVLLALGTFCFEYLSFPSEKFNY